MGDFLFGCWVGAMFGFVAAAVLASGRRGDDGDAEVSTVIEPAEDVYAMAERYAHDVGSDEGHIAATQEVEDYEGPSSGEGRGDDAGVLD